jgi:general secretion pathway protein F
VVSVAVLLFLVGFVVPRFAQVYDDLGDRLSPASRALLALGQAMTAHPVAFGAGALLAVLVAVGVWRAGGGMLARAALTRAVPPLARVIETAELTRLYRTLAMLLAGGMPLVASLDLAAGVLPKPAGERLRRARVAIAEGRAFADSLAAHRLTTRVAERFFRVGERTGRLAEMVDHAADFHEEEVARFADRVARVIGPLMMLVMGTLIGLVVVLMYMPIFQLTEVLQ